MKKIVRIIAAVTAAGIFLTLTARTLLENQAKAEARIYRPDQTAAVLVAVEPVARKNLTETRDYIGSFIPTRQNQIASETEGKVVYVGVEEGDEVRAGQVVARVNAELLRLQLQAVEVQLEDAAGDVARFTPLVAADAIPGVQLEKARLAQRAAEVRIASLREQIARTTIVAPYRGVVTRRSFGPGSVLGPGLPLIELADISEMKLNLNVPEKDLARFREGQELTVVADAYPGVEFPGRVIMIGVSGDAAHNFPVHVLVSNSKEHRLRSGMFGRVEAAASSGSEAPVIPRHALTGTAKDSRVFVIEEGVARLRPVRLGRATDRYYQVLEGLQEGELVVTSGQIGLTDGTPVTIGESPGPAPYSETSPFPNPTKP